MESLDHARRRQAGEARATGEAHQRVLDDVIEMMRGAEQGELYEQFSDSAANITDGGDAQSLSPVNLANSPVSDTINSLADTLVAKD